MIPMTLREISDLTGGTVGGLADSESADAVIITADVVTDSREAQPGALYVARVGETQDGHLFVSSAAAKGAVAALVSTPVDGLPYILVNDVQAGFAAISRAVIERHGGLTVIGITGSSGKTSTKDLLGHVLSTVAPTVAPVGSYNSEVGVPLTVCRVQPDTRFLVVEMGARGLGHIHYLTTMAPPQIGVELNVGTAHVGEFGSREAIAQAKAELVEALPQEGVAILNADDLAVRQMAQATSARVVMVGLSEDADVRASNVTLNDSGCASFTLHAAQGEVEVDLALVGAHHVGNALAVTAVALECGMELSAIASALGQAQALSRWRMEVTDRADGVTVINDAYNANPDSMAAALQALAQMSQKRRSWAVLGSMLELGDESDQDHADVGALAATLGINELVVVGEVAAPMVHGATAAGHGIRVRSVSDADAAESLLASEVCAPDVVLFKSSRDAGLRWLGDRIAHLKETHP